MAPLIEREGPGGHCLKGHYSERAACGGRGAGLERVLASRLARKEVLHLHHVVLRPRDDVEEAGHRGHLLALFLQEPVHELLRYEIALLASGERELLDLTGDALLLVEGKLDRGDDVLELDLRRLDRRHHDRLA